MGKCASMMCGEDSPIRKRNKLIEEDMDKHKMLARKTRKVLLLGAGESGKSTMFKQMKKNYLQLTPDDSTNETRRYDLRLNLVSGAQDFFNLLKKSDEAFLNEFMQNPKYTKAMDEILSKNYRRQEVIRTSFAAFAESLELLWGDQNVKAFWQKVWPYASGLSESWSKFADDCVNNWKNENPAKKWGSSTWIPSEEDEMLTRIRTTGINKQLFTDLDQNGGLFLEVIDVGGQRSERGKWLKFFSDTNTVLYVAAISEYNQNLYEEKGVNRLSESLELFANILEEEAFNTGESKGTDFILFLNKVDLFEKKLLDLKIPVNDSGLFPDAPSGPDQFDLQKNLDWMESKYQQIFHGRRPNQDLPCHRTTATNADENLIRVFDFVKKEVFAKLIEEFGF